MSPEQDESPMHCSCCDRRCLLCCTHCRCAAPLPVDAADELDGPDVIVTAPSHKEG